MIGVGSGIDREGGKFRQPPLWLTHAGFEWLWRLLQEPRRLWRRYLIRDMGFFPLVLAERLRRVPQDEGEQALERQSR